jgi:hypothetical protein
MKLIAALLVITPAMLGTAYADGDGQRSSRIQRSIYDVARGEPSYAPELYEGRAATMSEPTERLGPGGSNDPEYFRHETNVAQ